MLDIEAYGQLYNKLESFAANTQVDINHCGVFQQMKDSKAIERLVKIWCELNELSYCDRYGEDYDRLCDFIDFSQDGPTPNTFQALKWMQCISYNIEPDTIKRELTKAENEALDVLREAINEIMIRIIEGLPQYESASWCEAKLTA
jgi:hypothetical protein